MGFRRIVFLLFIGLPFVAEAQNAPVDREEILTVNEDSIVDVPLTICPGCCSYQLQEFRPQLSTIPETYRMCIFDRWGNLVFETVDYTTGWDGKKEGVMQPQDVYMWQITFSFPGGEEQKHTGHISLLRR